MRNIARLDARFRKGGFIGANGSRDIEIVRGSLPEFYTSVTSIQDMSFKQAACWNYVQSLEYSYN